MRILIISDMFSLEPWLLHDSEPTMMPAVYNLFRILGQRTDVHFDTVIIGKEEARAKNFDNGSSIRIHRQKQYLNHYVWKFRSLSRSYKEARSVLKDSTYDLIYGMGVYSIPAAKLAKEFNLPVVSRLYGTLLHDAMQKKQWHLVYSKYLLKYIELKMDYDLIIGTEDGTNLDKAIERLNAQQPFRLMYNGIDKTLKNKLLSLSAVSQVAAPIKMLSMGRLIGWKRHDLAINIVKELKNLGIRADLTILGDGAEEESLKNMAATFSLKSEVHFVKNIPRSQIPSVIAEHEIALFVYDASNLGNSLWECGLAGRIVVTRATGKTADVIKHGIDGICLDSENARQFALAIKELHKMRSIDYAQNLRKKLNDLLPNWEERIDAELKLLNQLLNDGKTHTSI